MFLSYSAHLACSNQEIDGTWVLAYDDSKTSIPIFNQVFTFKRGKYEAESYSGPSSYDKSNGLYKIEKSQLKLSDSTILSINLITNDSLILSDEKVTYTLKRLNDTLKNNESNKIILSGKKFEVDFDGHHYSNIGYNNGKISFESEPFKQSTEYYKRINHNGFDLIFQIFSAPKVIHKTYNDTILLYGFHKKTYKIRMWEK